MRKLFDILVLVALLGASDVLAQNAPTASDINAARIAEQVAPSVVLIFTGKGGKLESVGTGIIVRADGIVLVPYHLVKSAPEVQVRLKNGEIYDRVELIAYDERRNVAALRLPAVNLPVLSRSYSPESKVGDAVYVVSHEPGFAWSASQGVLSGVRLADDVPGAGGGYQIYQHTATVANGGGVLVDSQGYALGLITGTPAVGGFAVPLGSVLGLANGTNRTALGAGTELKPAEPVRLPAANAVLRTDPNELLRTAKILRISSGTQFFESVQLQNELRKKPEFAAWQLTIIDGWQGRDAADVEIEVDRPLFTYTFTYSITDRRTSVVLMTGKVTAWDGNAAAPKLAKRIIEDIKKVRQPAPPQPKRDAKAASAKN
ncbi:MAG: S1C family serine protease [Pyrinomonadaceae bacterium]